MTNVVACLSFSSSIERVPISHVVLLSKYAWLETPKVRSRLHRSGAYISASDTPEAGPSGRAERINRPVEVRAETTKRAGFCGWVPERRFLPLFPLFTFIFRVLLLLGSNCPIGIEPSQKAKQRTAGENTTLQSKHM